jgi:hypothetical protein
MAMNRKVSLYKYVNVDGKWRYAKAVFAPNNTLRAHAVLVNGVESVNKTGYYVLSYSRKWENVGQDPKEAVRVLNLRRGELLTEASGGSVVSDRKEVKVPTKTRENIEISSVSA